MQLAVGRCRPLPARGAPRPCPARGRDTDSFGFPWLPFTYPRRTWSGPRPYDGEDLGGKTWGEDLGKTWGQFIQVFFSQGLVTKKRAGTGARLAKGAGRDMLLGAEQEGGQPPRTLVESRHGPRRSPRAVDRCRLLPRPQPRPGPPDPLPRRRGPLPLPQTAGPLPRPLRVAALPLLPDGQPLAPAPARPLGPRGPPPWAPLGPRAPLLGPHSALGPTLGFPPWALPH